MAKLLKAKEAREMSAQERAERLTKVRHELRFGTEVTGLGGATKNPGRIRALRTEIARLLTVESEIRQRGGNPK